MFPVPLIMTRRVYMHWLVRTKVNYDENDGGADRIFTDMPRVYSVAR